MDGGSKDKKQSKEQTTMPSVATNPNYIPMQQPQPFAPGMQQMLAQQLANGYSSPGLLGSSAQDFGGLLTSIYSPQQIAADPIGVAQSIATATKVAAPKPAPSQSQSAPANEGLRGSRTMGGQR